MKQRLVRFNDVTAAYLDQKDEIDAAIARVVARGDFINGAAVREFEAAFAAACGAAHCVGCGSGTAALHLALASCGIGPGDEVITSAMTFIATAEAIDHAGARVVFADVEADTLNLSARTIEARITPTTRAILFVHLHGNPSGILEVAELARKRGLKLIEDCAQAHGATVRIGNEAEKHVGTFGDAGAFSFFPGKNVGAFGDAGALITDNAAVAETAARLANHGREEKYRHLVIGYNYRLDTLQAAVLRLKLERLPWQITRRNAICSEYEKCLGPLGFDFQQMQVAGTHARHLFVVLTARRDALRAHLADAGIETGIHYPIPLHLQPAYAGLAHRAGDFPASERTAETTLSLPLYPQLSAGHVDLVCQAVETFAKRPAR